MADSTHDTRETGGQIAELRDVLGQLLADPFYHHVGLIGHPTRHGDDKVELTISRDLYDRALALALLKDGGGVMSRTIDKCSESIAELTAQKDDAYAERDKCLVLTALMAQRLNLKVGIGLHVDKPGEEWDADWRNILFIDLPAGQVSWHIHDSEAHMFYFVGAYDGAWDGHTTEEKYQRVVEPGL